jgi:hypothetical protein
LRVIFIRFNGLQLARGKPHTRIGPKAYGVISRVRSTAQGRVIGQGLLQQLAKAVQIGFCHLPAQGVQQTAGFQPGIR